MKKTVFFLPAVLVLIVWILGVIRPLQYGCEFLEYSVVFTQINAETALSFLPSGQSFSFADEFLSENYSVSFAHRIFSSEGPGLDRLLEHWDHYFFRLRLPIWIGFTITLAIPFLILRCGLGRTKS